MAAIKDQKNPVYPVIQSIHIKCGVYIYPLIDLTVLIIDKSSQLEMTAVVDLAVIHLEPVGLL